MKYRVELTRRAETDAYEACRWIAERSPGNAVEWYYGLVEAIDTLDQFPGRCPIAPEDAAFIPEIRQLLYGVYRVLFTVEDDRVRVLHIRHGARRMLGDEGAELP